MRQFLYVLLSVLLLATTLSPVAIFAYKKYHGLEDIAGSGSTDAAEEAIDQSECKVRIQIDNFQRTYPSPSDQICAVLICRSGLCALKSGGSEETLFSQSDKIGAEVAQAYEKISPTTEESSTDDESSATETSETDQNQYEYPLWQWSSIFSVAIGFSMLGITTSVISRNGMSLGGNLSANTAGIVVLYFMAVGSGAIMVSLFAGGFLQGSMFPNFTSDVENFGFNSWVALKFRGNDWFKLAIWAYVAGFYERFIPNVLDRVMKRIDNDGQTSK